MTYLFYNQLKNNKKINKENKSSVTNKKQPDAEYFIDQKPLNKNL